MYDSWHYEYYLWYLLGSLGTAALYVGAIIGVLTVAATWMVYSKGRGARLGPRWSRFTAQYVLYKITWGNGWLFLLLLVPFVNVVVGIITLVKLSKSLRARRRLRLRADFPEHDIHADPRLRLQQVRRPRRRQRRLARGFPGRLLRRRAAAL